VAVILTEDETIDAALAGRSLARFGDGELRLLMGVGSSAISQRADPKLGLELQRLLVGPSKSLVCLPRLVDGDMGIKMPAKQHDIWVRYMRQHRYNRFYRQALYGSTHCTRPDSAPWIDRGDYWDKVRRLWAGKRTVLVAGTVRSLTPDMMRDAKSVEVVGGPRRDAYEVIDNLEKVCLDTTADVFVLCMGATATVLAERLAKRGRHALDLGHVGMMMRRVEQNRRTWPVEAL
jgi:hypothetical protein